MKHIFLSMLTALCIQGAFASSALVPETIDSLTHQYRTVSAKFSPEQNAKIENLIETVPALTMIIKTESQYSIMSDYSYFCSYQDDTSELLKTLGLTLVASITQHDALPSARQLETYVKCFLRQLINYTN